MVTGSAVGVATLGQSADAVPKCPGKTSSSPVLSAQPAGVNLSLCHSGDSTQLIGKIDLDKIASDRNPNAPGGLGSIRIPFQYPPKAP